MTFEQFQKKILRVNWFDKYFDQVLFLAVAVGGFIFLYDVIVHQSKYDKLGTRYLGYAAFLFLTGLGASGLYFIPKRYKVITIPSTASIDKKKEIIAEVIKELGDPCCNTGNELYEFTYKKNWRSAKYKIYLSFDPGNFYANVQSITRGDRRGIIDLGGTEKMRQKLIACLNDLMNKQL